MYRTLPYRGPVEARSSAPQAIASLAVAALVVLAVYKLGLLLTCVAVVGIAFLTVAALAPDSAVVVVLFILYSNVTVVAYRYYGVPEQLAAGVFLLLGLPFLFHVVLRRRGVVIDRIFVLMCAYFVVMIVSALVSGRPAASYESLTRFIVEGLLLYFLIVNTIRTPELLRKAVWSVFLAGILMAALSVYYARNQAAGASGFAQTANRQIKTGGDDDMTSRAAGTVGETNRFAQVLVVLLPVGFWLYAGEPSSRRYLIAAGGFVIAAAILLTYSRAAALAMVALLVMQSVLARWRPRQLLLLGAMLIVISAVAAPGFWDRAATLASLGKVAHRGAEADSSLRFRAVLVSAGWRMFLDEPVFGVGPGQSNQHVPRYATSDLRRVYTSKRLHNLYVEQLAEGGIVGFVSFFLIFLAALLGLHRARRAGRSAGVDSRLLTALMLSIVVYLVTAVSLHLSYQRFLWVWIALAAVAIRIAGERQPLAVIPAQSQSAMSAP